MRAGLGPAARPPTARRSGARGAARCARSATTPSWPGDAGRRARPGCRRLAWRTAREALAPRPGARAGAARAATCRRWPAPTAATPARCPACAGPLGSSARAARSPACRWCGRPAADWTLPAAAAGTGCGPPVVGAAAHRRGAGPGLPRRAGAHLAAATRVLATVAGRAGAGRRHARGRAGRRRRLRRRAAARRLGAAGRGRTCGRPRRRCAAGWPRPRWSGPAADGGTVVVVADAGDRRPVQALVRWDPAGLRRPRAGRAGGAAASPRGPDGLADRVGRRGRGLPGGWPSCPAGAEVLGPVPRPATDAGAVPGARAGPRGAATRGRAQGGRRRAQRPQGERQRSGSRSTRLEIA